MTNNQRCAQGSSGAEIPPPQKCLHGTQCKAFRHTGLVIPEGPTANARQASSTAHSSACSQIGQGSGTTHARLPVLLLWPYHTLTHDLGATYLALCTSDSSGVKWRKQQHLPRGALWRKVSGGNKRSKVNYLHYLPTPTFLSDSSDTHVL